MSSETHLVDVRDLQLASTPLCQRLVGPFCRSLVGPLYVDGADYLRKQPSNVRPALAIAAPGFDRRLPTKL